MNTAVNLFILTAFMILKAMMIPGATASILESPRLDTIGLTYSIEELTAPIEVPDCNELVLCLNVPFGIVADFIVRLFKVVVTVIQIAFNIIAFIFQVLALIIALVVTQVPGAPIYVNVLLITIPAIMLGLTIINAFKPGVKSE